MAEVRFAFAIVMVVCAAFIVVMNWVWFLVSAVNRRRGIDKHHSTVPLISFILTGVFAYPLYPYAPKTWMAIIPAVDIGTWILLLGAPLAVIRRALRGTDE